MTTEAIATTIKAGAALAALDQVLIALGGRDRPILAGVHVEATDEEITFTAADGYQLVTIRVPLAGGARWSAILDGDGIKAALPAIKALIKATPKSQHDGAAITLEYVEEVPDGQTGNARYGPTYSGHVALTAGMQRVIVPTLAGQFPECSQIIPEARKQAGNRSAFNGALIGKVFTTAAKYAGSGIVRLHLQDDPKKPARLDWCDDTGAWAGTAVIMPMFVSNWAA